jgi:hypothetical protein
MLLLMTGFIIIRCATSNQVDNLESIDREIPTAENCAKSEEKIKFRNQFFKALRGRGLLETSDSQFDVDLALVFPDRLRIEVLGPLGIKYALVVANNKWVLIYIPKHKTVYRIPSRELLSSESERGLVFRQNIPFEFNPALLVPALMSRPIFESTASMGCKQKKCQVNEQWRTLVVGSMCRGTENPEMAINSTFQVHPEFAYPYEWGAELTLGVKKVARHKVSYKSFTGAGVSSLPSEIVFSDGKQELFTFSWVEAEKWENPEDETFQWPIPAGVGVKDY